MQNSNGSRKGITHCGSNALLLATLPREEDIYIKFEIQTLQIHGEQGLEDRRRECTQDAEHLGIGLVADSQNLLRRIVIR
jgi:hypothetical protein